MIMLMALAAAVPMIFNCKLNPALALHRNNGSVTSNVISFPDAPGSWDFSLKLNRDTAEIHWADSPMQLSGKSPILETADNSGMFVSVAEGPCLFTEEACGTLIQYAAQKDRTVKVLLTPTALATDKNANTREPFLVMLDGVCTQEGAKP